MTDEAADLQQAVRLLRAERWEPAAVLLKDVISRDPTLPAAFTALGVALIGLGHLERAVEAIERAHYQAPSDPWILYHYGVALQVLGRTAAAQQRFTASENLRLRGETGSPELAALVEAMASAVSRAASGTSPDPLLLSLLSRAEQGSFTNTHAGQPAAELPASALPARPAAPPATVSLPSPEPARPAEPPSSPLSSLRRTSETLQPPDQEYEDWTRVPPNARFTPRPYRPNLLEPARVALSPGNLVPDDEPAEMEPPPGFVGILMATLQLWLQQPLPWLLVLAAGNAAAVLLEPVLGGGRWITSVIWSLALALGAAPALLILADQWVLGRSIPALGPSTLVRSTRAFVLAFTYLLVTLTPLLILLSLRSPLPIYLLLPAALTLALPIHALFAPALVLAATEGPGGVAAIRVSFLLAGRRTWLHLGVMLLTSLVIGSALGGLVWTLTRMLVGVGDAVPRMWQVVGLSLGEGLWCALITICGMDALATPLDEEERAHAHLTAPEEDRLSGGFPVRS